ncbi:MAG: glutamine-hydrolyzing carbamoyl-phosphate synthase small subunit [archaeon]
MNALLVLEDGSYFKGIGFGAEKRVEGEVVFNTGMVGYTECLTDPSYNGQILALTYPLVGNYGVPKYKYDSWELPVNFESSGIKVQGLITGEVCHNPSHWQCNKTLPEWFFKEKKVGIAGIDTRALTKKLRAFGSMRGILEVGHPDLETLKVEVKNVDDPNARNLVSEVSVKKPVTYGDGKKNIVLVDCGAKANIIRELCQRDSTVVVVPYNYSANRIMDIEPDGVVVSNGPGDPKMLLDSTVYAARELMGEKIPMFGICLGNQIMGLAFGIDTYKLKFGHRSQNQPCIDMRTKRCFITSQNHGFVLDEKGFPKDVRPWFVNANDKTIEGIRHASGKFFSVQFHPEANAGPVDTAYLFDEFLGVCND